MRRLWHAVIDASISQKATIKFSPDEFAIHFRGKVAGIRTWTAYTPPPDK
jgi:hypothetical protein